MSLQEIGIALGCEVAGMASAIGEEVSIIDLRHIKSIWIWVNSR